MADVAIDVIKTKNTGSADQPRYESKVKITSKDGDITNVPIVFAFEDGKTVERTWSGKDGKVTYTLEYSTPLAWAMVDPKYSIVLENKHINNFMKAEMDPKVVTRWNLSIAKLVETLFSSLSW